jgi:Family of unknown function (DUF6166)
MEQGHVYVGRRNGPMGRNLVWRNGREFTPEKSLAIRRHSPDGFNWGYCGSGPAQLALALLLDALGSRRAAEQWYQQFKFQVIAGLEASWVMTQTEINVWYQNAKPEKSCAREILTDEESENDHRSSTGNGTAAPSSNGGE